MLIHTTEASLGVWSNVRGYIMEDTQALAEHIAEFGLDSVEAIEHTPDGVTVRCVARYYNAKVGRTSYTPFLVTVSESCCKEHGITVQQ